MVWHAPLHAFHCEGCDGWEEIHSRRIRNNPELLDEHRELLMLDHTECWEFDDPKMAADARKYRKDKKRRELLKQRAGSALDRQSVQWRGRQ